MNRKLFLIPIIMCANFSSVFGLQTDSLSYSNFFDCVYSNNRWDNEEKLCFPGRTWTKVPVEEMSLYARDYTPEEIEIATEAVFLNPENFESCHQENPEVIAFLGSGGAGKTRIINALRDGTLKIPNAAPLDISKYAQYDGDVIRFSQKNYNAYKNQYEIGYTDLRKYVNPYVNKVKKHIVSEIIKNQCNTILTMVGDRAALNTFIDANYNVSYNYVYLDYETTKLRVQNRGHVIGRFVEDTQEQKQKWLDQLNFAIDLADKYPEKTQLISNVGEIPRLMLKEELIEIRKQYQ